MTALRRIRSRQTLLVLLGNLLLHAIRVGGFLPTIEKRRGTSVAADLCPFRRLRSAAQENDMIVSTDAWEVTENDAAAALSDKLPTGDSTDILGDDCDSLIPEYMRWKDALDSCRQTLDKKQTSLQLELEKAESVEETIQRAELITSNMYLFSPGVRSATVNDWNRDGIEVQLTLNDAYDSASAEADALFQRARKLKRGSKIVLPLLEEIENAKQIVSDIQVDFEALVNPDGSINESILRLMQERLKKSSQTTGFREPHVSDSTSKPKRKQQQSTGRKQKPVLGTPASNIRKFVSPGGCVVIVGRNRKGNEYLSFNIARGNDIWMHARGCPGAHVLIQQRRGSPPPTDACLEFAADLAAFYSDARSELSYDVTTTEAKHLLKPRGAPLGAVKLRQESRTLVGRPDNVPEECKEAFDASGHNTDRRFQKTQNTPKQDRKIGSQITREVVEQEEESYGQSLQDAGAMESNTNVEDPVRYWLDLRGTAIRPDEALLFFDKFLTEGNNKQQNTRHVQSVVDCIISSRDTFRDLSEGFDVPCLVVEDHSNDLYSMDGEVQGSFAASRDSEILNPLDYLNLYNNGKWVLIDSKEADTEELSSWVDQIRSLLELLPSSRTPFSMDDPSGLILPSLSGDDDSSIATDPQGGVGICCSTKEAVFAIKALLQQVLAGAASVESSDSGILLISKDGGDRISLPCALVLPFDLDLWKSALDLRWGGQGEVPPRQEEEDAAERRRASRQGKGKRRRKK